MDLSLTDRIAIVTGSSRGLGLASARALVAEGCRVCMCARGSERLAEAALEVEAAARRPNMILAVQAEGLVERRVTRVVGRQDGDAELVAPSADGAAHEGAPPAGR